MLYNVFLQINDYTLYIEASPFSRLITMTAKKNSLAYWKAKYEKEAEKKNPKSTTMAEKPIVKAVQGQPIEIYPNANLGLTREKSIKAKNGFIRNSIEVCPNADGGCQMFASSFVNKDKSGYRGKLNAYLSKDERIALAEALLKAPHIPRTDV